MSTCRSLKEKLTRIIGIHHHRHFTLDDLLFHRDFNDEERGILRWADSSRCSGYRLGHHFVQRRVDTWHVMEFEEHRKQELKVIGLAIDEGPPANDGLPDNPLCRAVFQGDGQKIQELLDDGADVDAHDTSGLRALDFAALRGDLGLVRLLVEKGADPRGHTEEGSTVLMSAAESGSLELVVYLLDLGLDINERTESGTTPLHVAAMAGDAEYVEFLIGQGANVNAFDGRETPMDAALFMDNLGVYRVLKKYGGVVGVDVQ